MKRIAIVGSFPFVLTSCYTIEIKDVVEDKPKELDFTIEKINNSNYGSHLSGQEKRRQRRKNIRK